MSDVRLPAEWESQAGVMLTWPHDRTDWAPTLDGALPIFARIASTISLDEPIINVCRDTTHQAHVASLLAEKHAHRPNLRFAISPSNDTWARDHAPITTLQDDQPVLNDFAFDGWGGKFPADLDNAINRQLDRQQVFDGTTMRTHALVLEGGAIESDGLGTLLATRSSVLSKKRNPDLSDGQVEDILRETLGIRRFLWLEHGEISGDDTDAHVDILARFVDPHTIVYSSAPPDDADHPGLQAMLDQLKTFRDPDGNPYRLVELPFPGVLRDSAGRRLSASYANFLIINSAVLVPVYGVEPDRQAISLLQDCFPERRIEPINCRGIIEQNGSLHCLTMQFPAKVPIRNAVTMDA